VPSSPPKSYRRAGPSRPEAPRRDGGELDEVDRAISVLGGRHPEHAKTKRELREAGERRRVALGRELAEKAAMRARRARRIAGVGASLLIATVLGWRFAARAEAVRSALDRTEARWTELGFTAIANNELTGRAKLEADLPGASCFVALTSRDEMVRVSTAMSTFDGTKSVAWCACGASSATVDVGEAGPVGLAILRVDARELGGRLARAWTPFTPGAWGAGGESCENAALDGWIADHRWPMASVDTSWMEASPARPVLRRAGFRVVSGIDAAQPFGVVDAKASDCMLAIARDDVELSLRAAGAVWRIQGARKLMAWCTSTDVSASVWRPGASPVVVVAAPAARIGGLLGLQECAEAGGLHLAAQATWIDPDDLAWDAASLLRASTSLEATPYSLPTEPGTADGRILAVSLAAGTKLASDPPSVPFACDPPLAESAGAHGSICALAGPASWWHRGEGEVGAARSALPVWLSTLESRREVDAMARIPEMLALARRLGRERFEATLLEGVTELPDGVRVIGRAGEDAIVAVGLDPAPPWTSPYFAPGPGVAPWDLGDEPRVLPLAPGQTVKLVSYTERRTPIEKRRTVVFRRAVQVDPTP
jgi:hypothetical protein